MNSRRQEAARSTNDMTHDGKLRSARLLETGGDANGLMRRLGGDGKSSWGHLLKGPIAWERTDLIG